jgi:flagellar basal-body rod modification protein FlgD
MAQTGTISGPVGAGTAGSPDTVTRNDKAGAFGKDTFLKLLVAQMQHQDPMAPTDTSQMMAQLAQFASVEGLNNLQTQVTTLNMSQDFAASTNLIGHTVSWTDTQGALQTGVVDKVTPDPKGAVLHVGDRAFYSGQIAEVT